MNVFSVCVRFLSQHVCTRLLTYTVYSWLGCEPGALESCVAFPHRFCTPTTRGHSLCLGLGGGRSAVPYSAISLAFLFFFFFCFNVSTPLRFNSFLRFSFPFELVFAFGDADTHRAKEWERERGSECCDRSAVRSADSCPRLTSQPISFHCR